MWAMFLAAGVVFVAVGAWLRPKSPVSPPPRLMWLLALAGAVAVALSDATPTGWEPFDVLLRAGLGALVPLAARASTGSTFWLAAVATAAGVVAGGWPASTAAFSLGLLLGAIASEERGPVLRALAGAVAVAALAHLGDGTRLWLPSLAMAVAVFPVLVVGLIRAPERVRGWASVGISLSILVTIFGAVAGAYAAVQARTEVDRAVDAAVAGLDLLDGDDRAAAGQRLDEAAASFAEAEADLTVWWARPALLVPGVAQHSRAVSTMAGAGRDLSETAAAAVVEADVDSVRPVAGVVDLAAMEALREPLDASVESLRRADHRLRDVDSPVLVPPVADRLDDLSDRVEKALDSAETASAAVDVAPGLLGADGPRRYFLALQTPAELRGVGGFMGSWAELMIDQGRFELVRTGRVTDLTSGGPDPTGRRIKGQPTFVERYTQAPAQFWGLIGFSPDFPTVGSIIAELFPQSGGSPVDGVVAIDPSAFASFLALTGPISVPGFPQQLTPENAAKALLFDQYLEFPNQENEAREQFLADATQVLFDALTGGELPGPGAIAANLGPAVDGRHLQMFSVHDEEQRFFEAIGATGSVERHDGDVIGLVGQNYNGNKIDWFLRRSLSYDLTWNPDTGEVSGSVEARITNDAPAKGLPHSIIGWGGDASAGQIPVADGENFMQLSLFSTLPVSNVTVDGATADAVHFGQLGMEEAFSFVRVPSRSTVVVRADVAGLVERGDEYVLRLLRQATVSPDQVQIRIRLVDGWEADEVTGGERRDTGAEATWTAEAPHELRLRVERAGSEDRSLLGRLRDR